LDETISASAGHSEDGGGGAGMSSKGGSKGGGSGSASGSPQKPRGDRWDRPVESLGTHSIPPIMRRWMVIDPRTCNAYPFAVAVSVQSSNVLVCVCVCARLCLLCLPICTHVVNAAHSHLAPLRVCQCVFRAFDHRDDSLEYIGHHPRAHTACVRGVQLLLTHFVALHATTPHYACSVRQVAFWREGRVVRCCHHPARRTEESGRSQDGACSFLGVCALALHPLLRRWTSRPHVHARTRKHSCALKTHIAPHAAAHVRSPRSQLRMRIPSILQIHNGRPLCDSVHIGTFC
jgi:hypothetical protein